MFGKWTVKTLNTVKIKEVNFGKGLKFSKK